MARLELLAPDDDVEPMAKAAAGPFGRIKIGEQRLHGNPLALRIQ